MTIPSTIQDVIMARVDKLPEGAKEVVQTGSVIEREFSYELIKQVSGLSEKELFSRLSFLKDSEILFERGIYPESTYIFRHALIREVIYYSILTRRKKRLHEDIGNAIEELYKESITEHYGILAEHFISSENFGKGANYCKLAGRQAEKAGSLNDAIAHSHKQVFCLEKLPQTEGVEKSLIDTRTKLGLYHMQLADFHRAKAMVDPIVDLAIQRNYKRKISPIYCIIGQYEYVTGNIPDSLEYFEKALKMGEELNDLPTLVMVNLAMGIYLSSICEYSKANHHLQKALEINVAANVPWGIAAMKSWIAWVYHFQGKIDHACEVSNEAWQIADKSADVFSKAHAYTAQGWSYYGKGYLEKAGKYFLQGANFSEQANQVFWTGLGHFGLGHSYFDMESYKESQKHFEKAISYFRNASLYPSIVNYSKIALALAKVLNNEKDINLNEIFKYYEDINTKWCEGWMLNCIGEILLNIDDRHISNAENYIKRAITANKRNGMMWHLARDYALYAEFYKRKDEPSRAKETLNTAIEIFKECGADGWVERYKKELASIS
ncbi:MAG: hypothetical protein JRJ65_18110 [Deltaproteobacteria bacterium]|nr:hypothetical protein [Deltaproteobacteria bacterium]